MATANNHHQQNGSVKEQDDVTDFDKSVSARQNGSVKEQDDVTDFDMSKSLPKLPVPSLQSTLNKYLTVMKSVLSPPDFAKMSYIVEQFRQDGGEGEVLQNHLLKVFEETDNWVNRWWLDDMYLKIRLALPVNSNPGIVFPKQRFTNQKQQLRYATRLVCGVLDYKAMIDSHTLPVERARYNEKGQPMCMNQHYDIFSSYRAPGVVKDVQMKGLGNPGYDVIIVLCRNQLFSMEVASHSTTPSYDEIYQQLELVTKLAEVDAANAPPIGVLTSQSRDRWAECRIHLQKDPDNSESLECIENSIFVLCLDQNTVPSFQTGKKLDDTALALHTLHGQGSHVNTCNRWFDATMQFIVSANGTCGMNYEHSIAEGIAVIQMVDHALKFVENRQREKSPPLPDGLFSIPRKLTWNLSSDLLSDMDIATGHIDRLINDLDMSVLNFENFGREFPKSQGMSPDSFIQLALQLTYYKIHGTLVSTYESASTRRFRYGRVDNIRANSPLALEWAKGMIGEAEATDEEKFSLLKKALQWQADYLSEQTIQGQGIDGHLLGLRECAVELGRPAPELFTHKSYSIANHFKLSTSQVPTGRKDFFVCYGPVVPDGYGVCYNPYTDGMLFCITSFNSSDDTDSNFFSFTLESSLLQMRELCLKSALPSPVL